MNLELVGHDRDRSLLSLEFLVVQFANSPAIRFVQLHSEVRIADPAHRGFLYHQRILGRRDQEHHEFHADFHDVSAAKTATMICEVLRHAAGMEISI